MRSSLGNAILVERPDVKVCAVQLGAHRCSGYNVYSWLAAAVVLFWAAHCICRQLTAAGVLPCLQPAISCCCALLCSSLRL